MAKLISYSPTKRYKGKELDLERDEIKYELVKTHKNCEHITLEQLNTVYLKWMIHLYKRVQRLCALGGDKQSNYCHKPLMRQFEIIQEEYQKWMDNLVVHANVRNAAVIINQTDFVNAKILDRSQADVTDYVNAKVLDPSQTGVESLMTKWNGLKIRLLPYLLYCNDLPDIIKIKQASSYTKIQPFLSCRPQLVQLSSSQIKIQVQLLPHYRLLLVR